MVLSPLLLTPLSLSKVEGIDEREIERVVVKSDWVEAANPFSLQKGFAFMACGVKLGRIGDSG